MVLEKTLESPLDYKEVQPVHPKGYQSWVFSGRIDVEADTPILWPPGVRAGPERRLSTEELMLLNCDVEKDSRVPWTARRSN